MTVAALPRRTEIYAYQTGVALVFEFKIFDSTQVEVTAADSNGDETVLDPNDYAVVLNGDQDNEPGGTVTIKASAGDYATVVITSAIPETQEVIITNKGGFYPDILNDEYDKLTALIQQIREVLDRCLKVPLNSEKTPEEVLDEILDIAAKANEYAEKVIEIYDEIKGMADIIGELSDYIVKIGDGMDYLKVVADNIESVVKSAEYINEIIDVALDLFGATADSLDLGHINEDEDTWHVPEEGLLMAFYKMRDALNTVYENMEMLQQVIMNLQIIEAAGGWADAIISLQDDIASLIESFNELINDEEASEETVYSSSKVEELVAAEASARSEADMALQADIRELEAMAAGHVKYDEPQDLSDEEQEQARANIGVDLDSLVRATNAVLYVEQDLTEEEQEQARANIGVDRDSMVSATNAVLYVEQDLTEEQQAQARTNIGVDLDSLVSDFDDLSETVDELSSTVDGITDTKVTVTETNPESATSWYPASAAAVSMTGELLTSNNFRFHSRAGTADTDGLSYIFLGNNVESGTDGNSYGALRLYAASSYYADLRASDSIDSNKTFYLPGTAGCIPSTGSVTLTSIGNSIIPVYLNSSGVLTTCSRMIPASGDRGACAGYETCGSAATITETSYDGNTTSASITVSNGSSGTVWTKVVRLTAAGSVTLGSSWKWLYGTTPTISAGGILVLCWCGTGGIASFCANS